ncbi:Neurofibromin 1, partial [Ataeniobius toweri]|nr:Neurofibromin 1 [Ataeniobius toweri]
MFLRFINPAIVSPYEAGILDKKPLPRVERGLKLMSKILQSIANHVLFTKEEHMRPFNDFVKSNFDSARSGLPHLCLPDQDAEPQQEVDIPLHPGQENPGQPYTAGRVSYK